MTRQRQILVTVTYNDLGCIIDTKAEPYEEPNLQPTCNNLAADAISRQAAIDALIELYEYQRDIDPTEAADLVRQGIYLAEKKIEQLPAAQLEHTCVNCGRTVNNGGWYADGRTRCPIEEHYALPKDGYCHLWEKRNITDDDYPERRTDEPEK